MMWEEQKLDKMDGLEMLADRVYHMIGVSLTYDRTLDVLRDAYAMGYRDGLKRTDPVRSSNMIGDRS